jgi:hypothetical protein
MQPNVEGWFGELPPEQSQEFVLHFLQTQKLFGEIKVQSGMATLDNDLTKIAGGTDVSLDTSINRFRSQAEAMAKIGDAYAQIAVSFNRMADILEELRNDKS